MLKPFVIALGAFAMTIAHAAAQPACPLTYEFFEFAIPHLDLEKCPADLARAGVFCRVTAASNAMHVFVFEEKGEQCLVAAKSYGEYAITLK